MALLDRLKKVQLRIGLLFHCLLLSSNSFDDQQSDCFFSFFILQYHYQQNIKALP